MRTALSFEPASREAKKHGCTCPGSNEIEIECPVHFPLYYMQLAEKLDKHIIDTMKSEKYLQYILIGLVAIDILARIMNCN